jgi:hypothetical protein
MLQPAIPLLLAMSAPLNADSNGLIDDFRRNDARSQLGTEWRLVTDQVMGGVSDARLTRRRVDGRSALCLNGTVSLENNGGFVQMNLDLSPNGVLDASRFDGIRLIVRGDGASYNLHLKTTATRLPWQSYRAEVPTHPSWRELKLPFSSFRPHRLVPALDVARLRRVAIVAIGRAMQADVCVAEIGFYRDPVSDQPS